MEYFGIESIKILLEAAIIDKELEHLKFNYTANHIHQNHQRLAGSCDSKHFRNDLYNSKPKKTPFQIGLDSSTKYASFSIH